VLRSQVSAVRNRH